jgi:hypothetical protein
MGLRVKNKVQSLAFDKISAGLSFDPNLNPAVLILTPGGIIAGQWQALP